MGGLGMTVGLGSMSLTGSTSNSDDESEELLGKRPFQQGITASNSGMQSDLKRRSLH
jgi:hypothetical protein